MDRRPLVFAVVGAMVSLAVVTLVLAIPAADRCTPKGRDLWDCVREGFAERYLRRDADAVEGLVAGTFIPPPPPSDLLADVPAGPPVIFELADVAEEGAIIARDLPAPQSRAAATIKGAESEPSPIAPEVPAPVTPPAPTPPPPEIDTIAFDGSGIVAGTGPDGTVIRVYLDGQLAGETRVERERWQVEGVDLGASLQQELRVDAVDPATGKVLGSSSFSIEIDLPGDPPPGAEAPLVPDPAPIAVPVVDAAPPSSEPSGGVADDTRKASLVSPGMPVDEAPEEAGHGDGSSPASLFRAQPTPVAVPSEPDSTPVADALPVAAETPLPRVRPLPLSRFSPSITFVGASDGGSIITLGK